ncbi:MAG: hypothetical protein ACOWWM_09315 [Desulfobacterales bacterium]
MIDITERARGEIAARLHNRRNQPLRIFIEDSDCAGPYLAIKEDFVRENDQVFEMEGMRIVVENNFLASAQPIRVDWTDGGLEISSDMPLDDVCSPCCECC